MKVLLIFDEFINVRRLKKRLRLTRSDSIFLFALTSCWRRVREVQNICDATNLHLLNSAEAVDREVDLLRERVSKWSSDLGNYSVTSKSLKEWFLLPGDEISTWWFSLISEKNNFKTNAFLKMAQIQAIDRIFAENSYELCVFSMTGKELTLAIKRISRRYSVKILQASAHLVLAYFKEYLSHFLKRDSWFISILKAMYHLFYRTFWFVVTKIVMGPVRYNKENIKNSILFVSYFPAVDNEAAEKGILKNKYAIPLQTKLSQIGKKITWLWMYVFLDGHTYIDALLLAKRFKKNGVINFFLEEFMSFKVFFKVLFLWWRQILIFFKIKRHIPDSVLYNNLCTPETVIPIKSLVLRSILGSTAIDGILFFELYKKIFSEFASASHCIYYAEMHAWEKALNAAKKLKAPQIKSIGFQHGGLSINHFFYFHHPDETADIESVTSLPLPDTLACNGEVTFNLMARCRYPGLKKVEAVRHLYLNSLINTPNFSDKKNIVLISGSVDKKETKALISLLYEVFPKPQKFEVWLKGHPILPLEGIFKELKIDYRKSGYIIKREPIDELHSKAKVLITGSSAVAVEALAGGCRIIIPVFSDSMSMSHLKSFEKFYIRVSTPDGLKYAVEEFMNYSQKEDNDEIKNFISHYWCLDESLQRWEELLV